MEIKAKILIMDGQGGKIGKLLVEQCKSQYPDLELIAIGSNSIATAAMMKAGADYGATGENPVLYNCEDATIILGPIGILIANSLFGEITPAMAAAVGKSKAKKILIPMNKCNTLVVGIQELPLNDYIKNAVEKIRDFL